MFFKTDGASAYHQVVLVIDSRDICTVRTPLGKIRPTRLPEGLKNSGTELQARLTMALSTISADLRAQISNYLDDTNCGARNSEELRRIVIAILDMCVTYQITLKPSKTRIGFETSEYAGV